MDIRGPSWAVVRRLQDEIMGIAQDVCDELETVGFPPHYNTDRCRFMFDVNRVIGRDPALDPIPGWDPGDNPQARFAAAAAHVLYGRPPTIDPNRGCGDCRNMYKAGLPAMSFRGDVLDYGDGRVEMGAPEQARLGGHDVTESMFVPLIWAGVKHALVFAVSYAGTPDVVRRR